MFLLRNKKIQLELSSIDLNYGLVNQHRLLLKTENVQQINWKALILF